MFINAGSKKNHLVYIEWSNIKLAEKLINIRLEFVILHFPGCSYSEMKAIHYILKNIKRELKNSKDRT